MWAVLRVTVCLKTARPNSGDLESRRIANGTKSDEFAYYDAFNPSQINNFSK